MKLRQHQCEMRNFCQSHTISGNCFYHALFNAQIKTFSQERLFRYIKKNRGKKE